MKIPEINFEKSDGLVPAIIQDANTGEVRMLGYMNEEALKLTANEGWVTFWSRSKRRLWQKGETSGNRLQVVDIRADCDNDALLITAEPTGPTCHTGSESCFGESLAAPANVQVLTDLYAVIKSRKEVRPEGSYTSKLFSDGLDRIAQKVGEEAVEVVIAAKNTEDDKFAGEVADLIYHLFVLLVERGVGLEEVTTTLKRRAQ